MDSVQLNPTHAIRPSDLKALLGQPDTPLILDVRHPDRFALSLWLLPSAVQVAPQVSAD